MMRAGSPRLVVVVPATHVSRFHRRQQPQERRVEKMQSHPEIPGFLSWKAGAHLIQVSARKVLLPELAIEDGGLQADPAELQLRQLDGRSYATLPDWEPQTMAIP